MLIVSEVSRLEAELAEALRQVTNYQNAAHVNHEKWLEEVEARRSDSLDCIALEYLTNGDTLRALIVGFGVMSFVGLTLEDLADALIEKYPHRCTEIKAAFGLR